MNRVLVTGASGFLGRAVITAFSDDGWTLRAAVRRPPAPSFQDSVEVVQHPDLQQAIDWRPLLDGVDSVIHLAAQRGGRRTSAEIYERVNHQATARLARAAAAAGIRRFVFVSSIRAQNGPAADHALTERDVAVPTDAYGRSKLAAEEAVRGAGVPFTILRPVPVYGPGMKGAFALLLRAAVSPLPLPVKNFGNRRSLLGIDNFISALTFVMSAPGTIGETYVVADPGIPPSVSDIFASVRRAQRRRPRLLPMQIHHFELPLRLARRGDLWEAFCGNLRVNPSKLMAAGWRPLHDTRAGLADLVRKSGAGPRSVTPPAAPPEPDRAQTQPD